MDREIVTLINDIEEKRMEQLDTNLIKKHKNNILQQLEVEKKELNHYLKVLKNYRFVDEIDEIKVGCYIRWFNLKDTNKIKLYNGAILTDIENINNNVLLKCKSFKNNFFRLNLNQCIVFQKLTEEELFLIKVLHYIKDT